MKSKLLKDGEEKIYAVVLNEGNSVMEELKSFAETNKVVSASFVSIGAFEKITLGYFDTEKKDYLKLSLEEQVEVLNLTGNISLHEDKIKIHAHVIIGRKDFSTLGGHLLEAVVRPTLEIIITELPEKMERMFDEKFKIPLIKLQD